MSLLGGDWRIRWIMLKGSGTVGYTGNFASGEARLLVSLERPKGLKYKLDWLSIGWRTLSF